MKYFKQCQLSSSKRPELLPKESLLLQQAHIGLYEGKSKLEGYQEGTLYLTSHRIIYVDNQKPLDHSVDIPIKAITNIDQYGGFLRSSPKLILYLDIDILNNTTTALWMVSDTDSLSTQAAKTMQLAAAVGIWTCPICSHDNTSLTEKCELCGVRTVDPPIISNTSQLENDNSNITGTCPACTFINHASMIRCEMCDTPLSNNLPPSLPPRSQSSSSSFSSVPSPSESSSSLPPIKSDTHVQLSFRKGGLGQFLTKLNTAISTKAWDFSSTSSSSLLKDSSTTTIGNNIDRRAVGIQGIQQRIEQLSSVTNDTMTDAFQDLDRLMANANEMVKLAETISSKMNKDPNDQDLSTLRGYMINLGISNPVTKGTAGSIYHQELSRELAEFLDKLYTKKENDIRPLTDIYCIFNRARGVALISPEDLYKACQQFEYLQLPYRLRQLSSSLLVVQSTLMNNDQASKRIVDHVKKNQGHLSALQLASLENWALAVALEQLQMAEEKGLLCRDDGPSGLVFYENLFI
ncbi:EAP30/Vps36 family-domain-containing protein [Halteromyces radiatus]|uniref:EAP30/Vps36 family-domain-containing protein n=1 Tax=Halteromyces radiatus TaxID=101107 RepID=UPI0022203E33|nr:EAP30/Vps36 family-domain-containing protein [Halteromyces radiatus]KAI8079936.1 EAP30/Vps36 family-domain-containing protein [Halteromyces radiatus]